MLIDDIALTMIPDVGPKTAIYLLECFGDARTLFNASVDELTERARLKPALVRSISRREKHAEAEQELEFAEKHNIRVVSSTSSDYPQRLRECTDYPHVLYVMGDIDLNSPHWLSIVGTRDITPYGTKMCETLIHEVATLLPDTVIVSGLAYGVDIAAHRAAMQAGLPTVGIVAHPLTHIYPSRHTDSARRIVREGGAVISEYNRTDSPDKSGFVQRNRIIAGLSSGTLIVESAAKGGSLITAEMADGYHRTVMAVPGRVGEKCSEGTNNLIKNLRAQMICDGQDIIDALDWTVSQKPEGMQYSFFMEEVESDGEFDKAVISKKRTVLTQKVISEEQKSTTLTGIGTIATRILNYINTDSPVSLDELSVRSELPVGSLAGPLLELELAGYIHALPGKYYLLR